MDGGATVRIETVDLSGREQVTMIPPSNETESPVEGLDDRYAEAYLEPGGVETQSYTVTGSSYVADIPPAENTCMYDPSACATNNFGSVSFAQTYTQFTTTPTGTSGQFNFDILWDIPLPNYTLIAAYVTFDSSATCTLNFYSWPIPTTPTVVSVQCLPIPALPTAGEEGELVILVQDINGIGVFVNPPSGTDKRFFPFVP